MPSATLLLLARRERRREMGADAVMMFGFPALS
jgi:hypothetical protein